MNDYIFLILLVVVTYILGLILGYVYREHKTEGTITFDFRDEAQAPVNIRLDNMPGHKTVVLKVEYLQDEIANNADSIMD